MYIPISDLVNLYFPWGIRLGYESWVAAEMIPPVPFYKHAPEVLIENTARAMDAISQL